MISIRLALILLLLFVSGVTLLAQDGEEQPTPGDSIYIDESVPVDSIYVDEEPTYVDEENRYGEPDTTYMGDGGYGSPPGMIESQLPTSFLPGGGIYGGPTFELTTLAPHDLDPALSGDLVMYGGQGYLIINGWLIGGAGVTATLYNISSNYDEFTFGYGGFLTGYDLEIVDNVSVRLGLLIGGGDLKMIKKRGDLSGSDSSGHEILERYRQESFFLARPGFSFGFAPLPILDVRIAADYLFPVGGEKMSDFRKVTYGLHLMFGFGR